MLKPLPFGAVGTGDHRSGWPHVLQGLAPLFSSDGILFEDFIERTFLYGTRRTHSEPWIGIMHHPADMPPWYLPRMHPQALDSNSDWVASLPQLKLLLTLAPNITQYCQQKWPNIPCVTLRHPTGKPLVYWSPERFLANRKKRLLQVGWFLRNMTAIETAHSPGFLLKSRLVQDRPWTREGYNLCHKHFIERLRRTPVGVVERISEQTAQEYDFLLAENVVFMEVLGAGASNTVVECIARGVPICINRQTGPEYYLGKHYPLFYETGQDLREVLTIERIIRAHEHIRRLDKWWLLVGMFREQVLAACQRYLPSHQFAEFSEFAYVESCDNEPNVPRNGR